MAAVSDLFQFGEVPAVLEPWLEKVVVVGGWAHRLHCLHPSAQSLTYPPLITLDADIAVPRQLPVDGQDIRQRLISKGFTEEFLGTDRPPATHYHRGGSSSGFYFELLTPLVGGEYDRKDQRKATLVVAGATSQQLRYIGLLLIRSWTIELSEATFSDRVHVANPASFAVQKLLVHPKRTASDRARDLLVYPRYAPVVRVAPPRIEGRVASPPSTSDRAADVGGTDRDLAGPYVELTDDIRRAARIAPERGLSPEAIREASVFGLEQRLW